RAGVPGSGVRPLRSGRGSGLLLRWRLLLIGGRAAGHAGVALGWRSLLGGSRGVGALARARGRTDEEQGYCRKNQQGNQFASHGPPLALGASVPPACTS